LKWWLGGASESLPKSDVSTACHELRRRSAWLRLPSPKTAKSLLRRNWWPILRLSGPHLFCRIDFHDDWSDT
jgi:hypothetical protein